MVLEVLDARRAVEQRREPGEDRVGVGVRDQ
jgi:hypothetical protein